MTQLAVVFPLYPGVTQLDFTGPHQVFSRLPGVAVTAASLGGRDIEADGLVFTRLSNLAEIEACDFLCVPGGFAATDMMLDDAYLCEIRRLGARARYVTSVCTGSLILAAAGLLDGKRAATHWAWRDLLSPFDITVSEARVERDGNVFTGGGVTAGIDLALTVAAEVAGPEVAQAIQLGVEYAPAPPYESGRPELASPEVVALVRARLASLEEPRHAMAMEAARRLRLV